MLPDEFWSLGWIRTAAYTAFAALGGVLGHLMRTIDKKEKIHLGRAALEGLAAGFVGLLILLVCQAMNFNENWTGVIVGVSGWLGAGVTMRILERIVRRKLRVATDSPQT